MFSNFEAKQSLHVNAKQNRHMVQGTTLMYSMSVALLSTRDAAWSFLAMQQHLHHQLTNAQR